MSIRITQGVIETSIKPSDAKIRITQAVLETSLKPTDSKIRITQIVIETSIAYSTAQQLTVFDDDSQYFQFPYTYQGIAFDVPDTEVGKLGFQGAGTDVILMDYKGYAVNPSLRYDPVQDVSFLKRKQPRVSVTFATPFVPIPPVTLVLTTTLASLLAHNTSAYAAYNQHNNAPDFTGTTWLDTGGTTQSVNSYIEDDSWNAITPCHVSNKSIHSLFPGYSGPIYGHIVPWFGQSNHTNIGVNYNTSAWAAAVCNYLQYCGFDGIIIDWYGSGRFEDSVTLLLKAQCATMTGFKYGIMVDQGGYTTQAGLVTEMNYVASTYYGTTNYITVGGVPAVWFFGTVGGVNYATVKSGMTTPGYWIMQGPGSLSNTYVDGCFDWVQPYGSGIPSDRYNVTDINSFLSSVHSSAKGSMPCLAPKFNGYVTKVKEGGYKAGYVLPSDNGKCWITQAATIAANYPTNIIGIQIATATDYEEGSEIETGIDNQITVTASITSNTLSWSIAGGTGDETTISSYQILAQVPGATPNDTAIIGTQIAGGSHTFNLSSVSGWGTISYNIYVYAIGIPCVHNQISSAVPYTA
jgi:hypothetical protein